MVNLSRKFNDTIIKTYIFELFNSNMYILIRKKEALIIDPNVSEAAVLLLKEHHVNNVVILLTHEHYDHISGVNWIRSSFPSQVICSKKCSFNLSNPKRNLSSFLAKMPFENPNYAQMATGIKPYSCYADSTFENHKKISLENFNAELLETPGHSPGSICILLDEEILFTGDTLIKDKKTITYLPGGDKTLFYNQTLPILKQLDKSVSIFPGHGEIAELSELLIEYEG